MAGIGRISLSINSPLRSMLLAVRTVPATLRRQINQQTRTAARPIWTEEVRDGANTRLQQRVLVGSARVGVDNRNVFLRSGGVGTLRSGTPVSRLASPAEFGQNADRKIEQRSSKGKLYQRRMGSVFRPFNRKGYVVYPAAKRSIPRFASLWVQTAVRTILDAFDESK